MPRLPSLVLAALVGVVGLSAVALAADPFAKQIEAKSPSIVIVKSVVKFSSQGGGDRESNDTRVATVVDASGVVMMPHWLPTALLSRMKVSPVKIQVLFDGEEKEYDAILGAVDSKLGLVFVRVKDLGDRKLAPVRFDEQVDLELGDELGGITRTDQAFDYVPYYGNAKLVGKITKPRLSWLVSGFTPIGHPLFTLDGRAAGVVVRQSGTSDEGSSERTTLLPASTLAPIIVQAVKASAKALEEAKALEKEAADEAAKNAADGAAMGETPAPEAPKPETPKPENPKPEMPKPDQPTPEGPGMEAPTPGMGEPGMGG